jgi:cell wall assembly regulator SMI1
MQEIIRSINNDFFLLNDSEVIQEMVDNDVIDNETINKRWLGFPAASASDIEEKERELGIELPPSYKDFLMVSNGFRFVSPFLDNLLSLEKVNWAQKTEEQWWFNMLEESSIEISDKEYFTYDSDEHLPWRGEYFRQSLKVSEWYDGMCVFLNH